MSPAVVSRAIPDLATPTTPRRPRIHTRILANGLRVIAINKNAVPLVEVRLRIDSPVSTDAMFSRATLLAETMMKGTASYDALELEQRIGLCGGHLDVGADRDKISIGGSTLSANLGDYLGLLSDVVQSATYPKNDVEQERGRLAERITVASSSAGTVAAKAIARKLFGTHPYAMVLPEISDIEATTAAATRGLHRARVLPSDAVLVIVGDLKPAKALDLAEATFGEWSGTAKLPTLADASYTPDSTITLVDRPGSVQSAIRLALPMIGRDDPRYAAARVANMLFGGYFSSRLVRNLREDKGYTYTPRSGIDLAKRASSMTINADVSTGVTGAALNEIRYELGRLATTTVTEEELENARQYLIGSGLLALSTQGGLASTCAGLEFAGVGLDFLWRHQRDLARVSAQDVREVAADLITPAAGRIVVVGDADAVRAELETIAPVELHTRESV